MRHIRLLVTGFASDGTLTVWRYNDKGVVDTSFGTSGRTAIAPSTDSQTSIARVQSDGRIVVVSASNGAVAVSRYWD